MNLEPATEIIPASDFAVFIHTRNRCRWDFQDGQVTRGLREPEQDTNREAGEREVKLLPPALEVLQAPKSFTLLKNQDVFQNPRTGEQWMGPGPIGFMWQSALRRTKVRYRNQYQMPHTYASTMQQG